MAAGVRSLLAPWVGGAGVPGVSAGYRGLLAFWVGGLATVPTSVVPRGWQHPISQERKREIRRQAKTTVTPPAVVDMRDLQDIVEMLVLWRRR